MEDDYKNEAYLEFKETVKPGYVIQTDDLRVTCEYHELDIIV
jgi:hypothetical protein